MFKVLFLIHFTVFAFSCSRALFLIHVHSHCRHNKFILLFVHFNGSFHVVSSFDFNPVREIISLSLILTTQQKTVVSLVTNNWICGGRISIDKWNFFHPQFLRLNRKEKKKTKAYKKSTTTIPLTRIINTTICEMEESNTPKLKEIYFCKSSWICALSDKSTAKCSLGAIKAKNT